MVYVARFRHVNGPGLLVYTASRPLIQQSEASGRDVECQSFTDDLRKMHILNACRSIAWDIFKGSVSLALSCYLFQKENNASHVRELP